MKRATWMAVSVLIAALAPRGPAALAAVAMPDGAGGVQAQVKLPSVDEILNRYVQAVDGEAAIGKLNSRVMTGTVLSPSTGDTGTIEVYRKAPNKLATLINIPSNGASGQGFNGTAGWTIDPDAGPIDLSGPDLDAIKLDADFYRVLRLKDLFPKMMVKGKEKVGAGEAYVIEAPHPDGSTESFYFDTTSGLLVRDDVPLNIPDEGQTVVENVYEDFREVDGIKLPFTIRQTSPEFDYVIRFTSIRHNVPIDDGKFSKPSSQ